MNFFISVKISLNCVPQGFTWQWSSTGSNNDLAPNRRQAIIWTNADTLTHICGTRERWINGQDNGLSPARHQSFTGLIVDCAMAYNLWWQSNKSKSNCFADDKKCVWKCRLQHIATLCSGLSVSSHFVTMMTSSNGNIFRVTGHLCGEFTGDLRLNKRFSKQSWGWWFETLSCPLWRHCNALYGLANKKMITGGHM